MQITGYYKNLLGKLSNKKALDMVVARKKDQPEKQIFTVIITDKHILVG